jgi:multiple antibiotic resistance protein
VNVIDLLGTLLGLLVPLFVAMDPVGALPLVIAWTSGLTADERERQLRDGLLTALAVCLLFVVGGRWLLGLLGVGVADFLVAGGLVLLVLAVSDLVMGGGHEARGSSARRDIGAVPIGTPILAGPATLATLLILVDRYGMLLALLALVLNLIVAWRLFYRAAIIARLFGRTGLGAASKVASLLLSAIAIKLIREGLVILIQAARTE